MDPGEHAFTMTHKTGLREMNHLDSRNVFKFSTIALDIKGLRKVEGEKRVKHHSFYQCDHSSDIARSQKDSCFFFLCFLQNECHYQSILYAWLHVCVCAH